MNRLVLAALLAAFSIPSFAGTPVVFTLKPVALSNGWRITGTITTDGTIGALTAANISDWDLKVVQTTDAVWTEKDSSNLDIAGVSTDGKRINVATFAALADGTIQDGGSLNFSRGGAVGRIPTTVYIADFTQTSVNLGYPGGTAGWQDEIQGLNFVDLNQRNNFQYRAGSAVAGQPNTFRVHVPTISTSPLLMTIFGTLTTDGTLGPLGPQNIVAWKMTARSQDITHYTKANSAVLEASNVRSDGEQIKVDRFDSANQTSGQFRIGIAGRRPTYATLADFTDSTYPNGFANYYIGSFGVVGEKPSLVGSRAASYSVTKAP